MSQTIKRVKINATCIFNGGKLCSAIVADANLGERNFVDHAWEGKVVGVGSTVAIADTGSSNPLSEEEWGGGRRNSCRLSSRRSENTAWLFATPSTNRA